MATAKQDPAILEPGWEDPVRAASRQRPTKHRILVVGDKSMADPLQSVIEDLPGVLVVGDLDETSCLLQRNGAGVVVVDILDRREAVAELCAGSSDRPIAGPNFGPEALEALGDLLKTVVDATRTASYRQPKRR